MNSAQVLLVNFDKLVQKSLYEMLCRAGHKVEIANSLEETLSNIDEGSFRVILTDITDSGDLKILKTIKEKTNNSSEIIALASYGNLEAAVSSIKMGAFDYLVRPVKDEKILSAIEQALVSKDLVKSKFFEKSRPTLLKKPSYDKDMFHGLVGNSQQVKDIYSVIERISNSKATVLVHGESGTGKRLIAYAIHSADKRRRHKPFVELSCGALPRDIIESELFGHTKGAFTGAISDRKGRFELAHGGTILLDDIDSLPLDLQVKLLRILQQREFERVGDHRTIKVDVRVIATTNQDIQKAVLEKKFREDLYYRINVIAMTIPPLRERKEDLPLLTEHFLKLYSKENYKNIKGISQEALQVLMNYNWPGNIRELENIIERAVILDTNAIIDKDDLPEIITNENGLLNVKHDAETVKRVATSLKEVLEEPEKVHILRVLKEVGWNKKKAARKLGVNRTTLYNKLKKYNILSCDNN